MITKWEKTFDTLRDQGWNVVYLSYFIKKFGYTWLAHANKQGFNVKGGVRIWMKHLETYLTGLRKC